MRAALAQMAHSALPAPHALPFERVHHPLIGMFVAAQCTSPGTCVAGATVLLGLYGSWAAWAATGEGGSRRQAAAEFSSMGCSQSQGKS
jgi:hypothetical protein